MVFVSPLLIQLTLKCRTESRAPAWQRGLPRPCADLGLFGLDQLDLLSGVLLERRDDLGDRLVLLGVEPLLPPHHEVGGLCADA